MDDDTLVEMLRRMWLIRLFDEGAARLLARGEIPGVIHLTHGQEGEVVGSCMAVGPGGRIFPSHRGHGHPIARGAAIGPLFAALMGKATGVRKGKGGSQHLCDGSVGVVMASAILGAGVPVAVGSALACSVHGDGGVVLACFGEGGSNEGAVHEAMNLAAIWKLPVIFFCENNGYEVTVAATYAVSVRDVADRAAGYGMAGVVVDGQDAIAVHEVVSAAAERARAGHGPAFIEAKTYRTCDHAENLPLTGAYRSAEEVARWSERDPIRLLRERLVADGTLTADGAAAVEAAARAEIDEGIRFALDSPYPEPGALFDDFWATPLPAARVPAGARP